MKIKSYKQVWSLWQSYEDILKAYVFKKVHNDEETHDLTQEILLKVHKSCCSDKEINNVRSWLFQTAQNTVVDYFKKNKTVTFNNEIINQKKEDVYQDISEFLTPLIGFLPEKYAIPLKLHDIDELKQDDIAKKLGISLSATKSRILRARKMLKEEIHTCFHIKSCDSQLEDFSLKSSCIPLQKYVKEKK